MIGRERAGALLMRRPIGGSQGSARIPIRVTTGDIAATGAIELEPWSGGVERLPAFFDDLASNWAGWIGSKEWRDDGGTVALGATHDRKAIVTLRLDLRDDAGLPSWRLEFELALEPGELQAIAERVRALVDSPTT